MQHFIVLPEDATTKRHIAIAFHYIVAIEETITGTRFKCREGLIYETSMNFTKVMEWFEELYVSKTGSENRRRNSRFS